MPNQRSEIILKNIQIKSLDKARALCSQLASIEEETFIKSGKITFVNPFICPWIDLEQLNSGEMENLVAGILKKIRDA
jgi:hypothetical protein